VSQTASDVKRGHWEATISCYEAIAQAKAFASTEAALSAKVEETAAPIAQATTTATEQTLIEPKAFAAPAAAALAAAAPAAAATPTAPVAIGTNDEPPNRGDNGRGRVQPAPAKKLMLSLVAVKRITSDIPASNFDQFELEIAGELSLTLGGFVIPPVVVRDSSGYKIISGHFQYHAAVVARKLNPKAGENIPARVLESENHTTASAMLKMLKFVA
jgi:hypothetical protein